MSNEHTRKQIQESLQRAYDKMKNPDKREMLQAERKKKAKIVARNYGL